MKTPDELLELFLEANRQFLAQSTDLITTQVSERTLCGALMLAMDRVIEQKDTCCGYKGYFLDVEYNRNGGKVKTIIGGDSRIITINCDLILHSRGHNKLQDNLIAVEMKKSSRPRSEKESDRQRLIALTTMDSDIWSADGRTLPEHVCRYALGVYYEVNPRKGTILLEFYKRGAYWRTLRQVSKHQVAAVTMVP